MVGGADTVLVRLKHRGRCVLGACSVSPRSIWQSPEVLVHVAVVVRVARSMCCGAVRGAAARAPVVVACGRWWCGKVRWARAPVQQRTGAALALFGTKIQVFMLTV